MNAVRSAAALVPMTVFASFIAWSGSANAEIAWRQDLTSAHAEAQQQGKALLLHFFIDNCAPCRRLEAGAFQDPNVGAAVDQRFVPVKIHAGKSPELAEMFKVKSFPSDVVVTPTGQTLIHSISPQDPNRYIAMLNQAASQMPAAAPTMPPTAPQTMLASNQMPSPTNAGSASNGMQMPVQTHLGGPAPSDMPTNNTMVPSTAKMGLPMQNPHVQANPSATNFDLPSPESQLAGGATARLAGARTDGMSLGMPSQSKSAPSAAEPKLAMEGFCSVTVIQEDRWAEGNPKFGVVHLGKLYLFESDAKMQTFLADPKPYTPVLNEIDVVRFFEERVIVPGKRQFGMKDPVHQRMFFFADEAAMDHFWNEYERYTDAAIEVMDRAVHDANPDAS